MMSKQNIPELRFPEFSGEWEEKKLEEIMSFSKGKGISKSDLSDEGASCVLYGELYTKYNEEINEVHSKTNLPKDRLKYAFFNDVLIPSSGETSIDIATASSVGVDNVLAGGDINILTPKEDVKGPFVSLMINGKYKFELAKYAQGKTVVHLYNNDIKKLEMKYPSIEEQDKICALFTKLNRLIELEEKNLELLEEEKKGYMQKIFSQELRFKDENGDDYPQWEEKILGDMGVTYTGLSGKTKENFGIGDAQFITYKNVFNHLFADISGIQQVEVQENEKQSSVRENDILFTTSSETPEEVGMASIWRYETSNTYLNSFCFGYRLEDSEVSAEFLAISLRQEYMRRKITLLGQGSTRFNLSKREVMKLSVLVPCLQEQYKITDLYKKMMYRVNMKKEKINSLKRRKKGLLQKLFI